ncbi:hypothetical protein DPMN_188062 [Dreissena polymorpha]|uniref:Uncharacterized protein n=1 Tax=Dreissena polymorpha TaxID=45954 RepID=A0A9D4DQ73_DREPO|nr:hypothetical protein DPMN_188062 [Dreissena polymorpha]
MVYGEPLAAAPVAVAVKSVTPEAVFSGIAAVTDPLIMAPFVPVTEPAVIVQPEI